MHRTSLRAGIVLILAASALAGCSKKNSPSSGIMDPTGGASGGAAMERAAVTSTMSATPQLIEDEFSESSDQTTIGGTNAMVGTSATPDAAIQPITFFRRITSATRTFEFAFSDTDSTGRPTVADVTIRKHLLGTFNIIARTPADTLPPPPPPGTVVASLPGRPGLPDSTVHIVRKPLDDHWVRHIRLQRIQIAHRGEDDDKDGDDEGGSRWKVVATSGVKITSEGATTSISSLRVQTAGLDTTITNPLELIRLRRIFRLQSGAIVTLTATTGRNDDVVVLSYRIFRLKFHNNGDNTYTAQVQVGFMDGVHNFSVNALSHGTLFDDAAAYDSEAWILPYIVQPTTLADEMP